MSDVAEAARTCKVCGASGGKNLFHSHARSAGGLRATCKLCVKKKQEEVRKSGVKQKCKSCGMEGGCESFDLNPTNTRTGLLSQCKKCRSQTRKRYPPTARECTRCGIHGGIAEFHLNSANPSGLSAHCRKCQAEYGRAKRRGISRDELDGLMSEYHQCEICGTEVQWYTEMIQRANSAHIDHDHVTGAIRGVLCNQCNVALGYFQDSPSLLWKATVYLQRNRRGL